MRSSVIEVRKPEGENVSKRTTTSLVTLASLLVGTATLAVAADGLTGLDREWVKMQAARNDAWAARAFGERAGSELPFSFVYGGRTSATFIGGWKKEVKQEPADKTRLVRTVTLTDPDTRLEVKAVATVYADTPGVDWTLYFTNRGDQDTPIIEQVRAIDTVLSTVKPETPVVLHRLKGSVCAADDWIPFDEPIPSGQRIDMATSGGRSASISPFFNVDWGDGGAIVGVGWSGQWMADVQRDRDAKVIVRAGMAEMRLILHAGETIRSPRILLLQWSGHDALDAYNLFRRTMLAHICVRSDGQLVLPPIAHMSTSFYELNNTNEGHVLTHLESARGLGFDTFWLDAYWHGPSGFPGSQGNYGFPIERVEPKDRFPHGLKAIGEAVEKAGLKFLLWFEPERVAGGALIGKEHPEWVLSPSGDGSGLFNLGNSDARKFMTDYLDAALKAYKVTCLRIDYNIDPLAFWQFGDRQETARTGMTEIRYIEGLYRMWDDVRRANPGLYIDNCASGGRRIDLETMSRSIPLWRSDNTCDMLDLKPETILLAAMKNQVMSAGLNRYVPFSTVGQMGTTPYLFRSGFNAGIAFAEDTRPAAFSREQLKQAIAEGRRIRKYYAGDFYPLTPVTLDPKDWCVMQYHRATEQDGMVVAFRRPQSPYSGFALNGLRGIDDHADYVVTMSSTYTPAAPVTMKGAALRALEANVAEKPGSVIVEYARK